MPGRRYIAKPDGQIISYYGGVVEKDNHSVTFIFSRNLNFLTRVIPVYSYRQSGDFPAKVRTARDLKTILSYATVFRKIHRLAFVISRQTIRNLLKEFIYLLGGRLCFKKKITVRKYH